MSRFPHATRGASVLAALVLAAFLASIALLVQQGSPIALSSKPQSMQAQAANTTNNTSPSTQTKSQFDCTKSAGYDVKVTDSGQITSVPVCPGIKSSASGIAYPDSPNSTQLASYFGSDLRNSRGGGRCVLGPDGKNLVPAANWKCVQQTCHSSASGRNGTQTTTTCSYAYNSGTEKSDGAASVPASTPNADIARAAVDGDPAAQAKVQELLKTDPSFNQTMADAYSDKEQDIQGQLQQVTDQYDSVLKQLAGCTGSSSAQCQDLNTQKAALEQQGNDLNQQYQDLTATEKKLTPDLAGWCASSGADCGAVPPPNTTCSGPNCNSNQPYNPPSGGDGNTFGNGNSAACMACQQNPNNGNACMQCKGSGPGGFGGQGGPQGGQPNNGQQCRPQYFCSGNTVMYAQCYNLQQGNAQQVQQCQQGYSCQNNSCQPQAIYGYCADGRTPRSAPAQQQPPASSCTVGTWQDTSNGCQTNWQCIPGNGGTSSTTPTAQLSCQPLSAVSGSTVSFSYACAGGATDIAASGFPITATTLSGNATTTIQKPAGGNSVAYSLSCINKSVSPAATASAQCTVQVGNASIVLVATPDRVAQSETDTTKKQSTIGWVTSGMQACTIADPDFSDWTSQQAGNTSVSGAATSPVITTTTTFTLTCTTLAGTTASSSVKVLSI